MSLATNSWAKNNWLMGSPFPAQHPVSAGARKRLSLGSRSCLGAGAQTSRVNPALTGPDSLNIFHHLVMGCKQQSGKC